MLSMFALKSIEIAAAKRDNDEMYNLVLLNKIISNKIHCWVELSLSLLLISRMQSLTFGADVSKNYVHLWVERLLHNSLINEMIIKSRSCTET